MLWVTWFVIVVSFSDYDYASDDEEDNDDNDDDADADDYDDDDDDDIVPFGNHVSHCFWLALQKSHLTTSRREAGETGIEHCFS